MPMKAAAFILSVFVAAVTVLSVAGAVVLFEIGGYTGTREQIRNDVLRSLSYSDSSLISTHYNNGVSDGDVKELFEDTNLRFTVKNDSGEFLDSTYNGESVVFEHTYFHTTDRYITESDEYGNEWSVQVSDDELEVTVYIISEMSAQDKYYYADKLTGKLYGMRYGLFAIAGTGLIFTVILWIYMICAAGRVSPDGHLCKSVLDRIPFDVWIAGVTAATLFGAMAVFDIFYYNDAFAVILLLLMCTAIYVLALLTVITFASRVKQGILIASTVIYRILHLLYRVLKRVIMRLGYITENISFIWKSVLITLGTAILALVFALVPNCYYTGIHIIIWFLGCAVVIPAVLYVASMLNNLKRGGEQIASGDLNAKVNTDYMIGDFKRFGESLNHINDGVRNAVDVSMRSERMKTELITNVSHDIKTPLTSIINYVDLIKKQQPENEQTREYVEVLDRQSIRLKKLIEDLVEASKASSGTLSVELAQCDVSVLLSQAVGEFDERLSAKNLQVIMNCPEYPVNIMADGRRLWRVFDNLLNNICKYALEGTRVYLDLFVSNGGVYVTFRNISKYPLNISGDELMERFVRGDRSRNTEGSGLGLSIAKSLTELQNGNMDISIDGDLFKVILEFGVMN